MNPQSGSNPRGRTVSPLIFLNSSNPVQDIKDRKHKKLVSRWSVINSLRFPLRLDPHQDTLDAGSRKDSIIQDFVQKAQGHPGNILSAATKDPFESLPFSIQPSTWALLNYWLNAGGAGLEKEIYRSQVSIIRKDMCFPLIKESEAAFAAAIALFESSISPVCPESRQSPIRSYLMQAYPALRDALARPTDSNGQHAALAIILLMTVAVNTRDMKALKAHFSGLSALLSERPDLVTDHAYTQGLVNVWALVFRPSELPDFLIFDSSKSSVRNEIQQKQGKGILELHQLGLLSNTIPTAILDYLALQPLIDRARSHNLSLENAADLLRCVWHQSIWLNAILYQCQTTMDRIIRYALILCFTLELVARPTHGLKALSAAIYLHMFKLEISAFQSATNSVLWLCLLAGPHTTGDMKIHIVEIVIKLRHVMNISKYEQARDACQTFPWPAKAELFAAEFWAESQPDILPRDENTLIETALVRKVSPFSHKESRRDMNTFMKCAFCSRPDCPNARVEDYPDHLRGMLWAMSVADFRKMCDIEWFDEDF